jgi:hypothetical protein
MHHLPMANDDVGSCANEPQTRRTARQRPRTGLVGGMRTVFIRGQFVLQDRSHRLSAPGIASRR